MSIAAFVLVGAIGLAFLYHALVLLLDLRLMATMPVLERLRPLEPARWPRVSVIIPACNEAAGLEAAMRSKLAEDYPDVEFILVDDRSTDGTGAIVDRLAERDRRIRAIHVTELPAGWLGKLNAMQKGVEASTGEWLLFSDADVHLAPGTLRRTVALCEERKLEHLSVVPELMGGGPMIDGCITAFLLPLGVVVQPRSVEDPRSKNACGVGAFNLVRRATLDRSPGFEWLKLEVGDDVALGQMLKRQAGARAAVANGRGMVRVLWYGSVREMASGAEKNGFALAGRYRVGILLAAGSFTYLVALAPLLALLPLGVPWLRPLAVADLAVTTGLAMAINRWVRAPLLPALLWIPGSLLLTSMVLRSGWLAVRRNGVAWRGTLYPLDALRAGQRITIP